MLNMKKKNNNAVAKSDKEELITALDIGSSHLRLLSGYVGPDKQIRIRGYKETNRTESIKLRLNKFKSLFKNIDIMPKFDKDVFECYLLF